MTRILDTRLDLGLDHCADCSSPFVSTGLGTGYGVDAQGVRRCYVCCGARERARMIEEGRAVLYLSETNETDRMWPGLDKPKRWAVTNWPGSLVFKTYGPPAPFRHPWTRKAVIAYFRGPDGHDWSARCIGEHTQIAHCRRLKSREKSATV